MREYNFFTSFKMTLKIHFLSKSRSAKILSSTKFNFKSIGDNFKFAAFLFYEVYAKKSFFWVFSPNLLKNKLAANLKFCLKKKNFFRNSLFRLVFDEYF
jgi:hypothetical protein